jgi:hypothetical protein
MSDKKQTNYYYMLSLFLITKKIADNVISSAIGNRINEDRLRYQSADNEVQREAIVQDLANKLTNKKLTKQERKDIDKENYKQAINSKIEELSKYDEKEETRALEEKNQLTLYEEKERAEAILAIEKERAEKDAEKRIEQERLQALAQGRTEGRDTQLTNLQNSMDATMGEVKLVREDVQTAITNIQAVNSALNEFKDGKYAGRVVQPEFKFDEGKHSIGGLGLSREQRREIKQIVGSVAGPSYAEAVDTISGEDIDPNQLFDALAGIGLSMALPLPSSVMTRLSRQFRQLVGLNINEFFDTVSVGDNEVILINKDDAERKREEFILKSREIKDNKENGASKSKALKQLDRISDKQQKETKGRKKRMINAAQTGAMIGMAAGSIVGGPIATVMGGSAGALAGVGTELISRSDIPRIAGEITQKIADATPRLPTVEGVRRGVRRAITTDTKDVPIPIPRLSTRGVNRQEMAVFNNRIEELNNEYNDLRQRQRRINDDMMANVEMGVSNTRLGLTEVARQITQAIRENRDRVLEIEYQVGRGPRPRLDIDRKDIEIPTLRRTTDEEKALVPFEEDTERMSKEKSLAVMGAAGSAVALAGGYAMRDSIPNFFREEPVQLPGDILTEQQDKIEKMQGKGLLRPKFIIPSTNILQPSDQELAADALEFAAFDFVRPNTEGGEGDLQTNILKRSQKLNENIRFQGAGVRVNSLFGYDLPVQPSQETINNLFLYKALPPLKFQEQEYNLSEFEVMSYDPINQRGAIEMFSPYNDFSDTIPDDRNEMDMSMLFSIVP